MKSKINLLALIISSFLIFGCSSQDQKPQAQGEMPPLPVITQTIQAGQVPIISEYIGLTSGSLAVEVRAQVGGILKKRNYVEGDYVEQGQILFEIEPDTYEANLSIAKAARSQAVASLERTQREWDRIRPLYKQNAVSQKDRDTARSDYESAKAALESADAAVKDAEIKLGYAYVAAPISGYTSKETITEGNLISSTGNNLLTSINQLNPLFVEFSIPSSDYLISSRLLTEGQAATDGKYVAEIIFSDGSVYEHKGIVTFIDTSVNITTSIVKARAVFPNAARMVLPGQFIRLKLSGLYLKDAILMKQTAMIKTQKGDMVMVVDKDNVATPRLVKLGRGIGNDFLVEEGLKAGDVIITEGVNKIRPGQKVQIVEPQKQAAEKAEQKPEAKKQ